MRIIISIVLFVFSFNAIGQIRLSELNPATTLSNSDLFLLSQGNASKKITYSLLRGTIADSDTARARQYVRAYVLAYGGATYTASQGITLTGSNFTLGGNATSDISIGGLNNKSFQIGTNTGSTMFGTIQLNSYNGTIASSLQLGSGRVDFSGSAHGNVGSSSVIRYSGDYVSNMTNANDIPSIKKVSAIVTDSLTNNIRPGLLPVNTTGEVALVALDSSPNSGTVLIPMSTITGGGGSANLGDGFLKVQGDSTFVIYPDSAGTGKFNGAYYGTQNPLKSTRVNLNGAYHANSFTGYGNNSESGIKAIASSSANTPALSAYSSIGGYVVSYNQIGSGTSNRLMTIGRGQTSGNVTGDIIGITDNPSTGGTISGKVLSATIGITERISLNPRATGTTVPYILASHNKVTGNLFEIKQQERTKVSADSSGHLTYTGTFASIYLNGSGAAQSIPTGTTPTKVTAFTTNGFNSNCTSDAANDKITITKVGYYDLNLSLSYSSGTANVTWTASIFQAGTAVANIHSMGKVVTANDIRSTALGGILHVTSVPCDIDYRVNHDNGGSVNLTVEYANMRVNYIGD